MNIRKLPASERPREKLLREGKKALSNSEILAILIGSGTKVNLVWNWLPRIRPGPGNGLRFPRGMQA